MASYNKVILMGNLTRDPKLSYLPSQTPVVEIGLAVNHRYKDQQGQQQEKVCFIDCQMFGKRAEIINQYCRKGQPLLVEGRLELDQWQDQQGNRRSKHRVFIENFSFVGGAQQGGGGGGYAPQQQQAPSYPNQGYNQAPPQQQQQQQAPPPSAYDESMPGGEDIPF